MTRLRRFDVPASLPDLKGWSSQQAAWSRELSSAFRKLLTHEPFAGIPTLQFYDPTKHDVPGPVFKQAITWNAFPRELVRRFGRAGAMVQADCLWPYLPESEKSADQGQLTAPRADPKGRLTRFFRPQSEYCEWRVESDPGNGRIARVTFTAEAPEYWAFMYGDSADDFEEIPKLQDLILALYHDLVDGRVQIDDLKATGVTPEEAETRNLSNGFYEAMNPWNTINGIAHLSCPSNKLLAELTLAANATRLFCNAAGDPLTYPDALCCAAGGNPNRNSDSTIIASINALARLGMMVTLANPVGICMDHIDTSGWRLPAGIAPGDCVKIVRGRKGSIARLVVEMPPKTGFTLSDLTIAGEPLKYGGQLAECITVRLDVVATGLHPVTGNPLEEFRQANLLTAAHPTRIRIPGPGVKSAAGAAVAFAAFDE